MGKSWITSAYVLWRLYCDPQDRFLVVSASKVRATDFSTFTLRLINEVPILRFLIPSDDQRSSKEGFDVGPARAAHAPSVKSVGITGQITGSRANHIIADDIEVPTNSYTQDMRDKLLKTVTEFEAIIVPEVGRITYLGTPQTEESVYNKLGAKGYIQRIWPARYPKLEGIHKYNGNLSPEIYERLGDDSALQGIPLDPERFTDQDLIEREASYGRSGFALQFMLDTSLSDANKYPLKTSDLIIMPLNTEKAPVSVQYGAGKQQQIDAIPNVGFSGDRWYKPLYVDKEWYEYEGSLLAIDPSGRGSDELAYCVLKQLYGKIFLLACGGLQGGYTDDNLLKLSRVAKTHSVNWCVIESNFGDGMFTKILTPVMAKYHPCTMEEIRHNTQKEKRIIDTLEPLMNAHRLIVDESLVNADVRECNDNPDYSLFYQMTRMNNSKGALKHDDRIDVVAMGVKYFVDSMARDEERAVKSHESLLLDKELEVFMENLVLNPNKPNRNRFVNTRFNT